MQNNARIKEQKKDTVRLKFRSMMACFCSGEQLRINEMAPLSDSLKEAQRKLDTGNIEEAESSLRESGCLNSEEARALLGRYEYQKGNIEAALHVLEGIDSSAVAPNIKLALARRGEHHKRRSQSEYVSSMSIHAASVLLEAIFLKAKSFEALGKFKEAAQSCKVVVDIVESSLPDGLPENFGADCKLQETLIKAVELLPELWKLADCPHEAVLSYRRALLHHRNLDAATTAKIQKQFAIYLLYSGSETSLPTLHSQMDTSFVPRNHLEESILLLMLLLRKSSLRIIEWDPSILDHLSFALSVSGQCRILACLVEELLPVFITQKDRYYILALCYHGDGDSFAALNLLRKLLASREDPNCVPALLITSQICSQNPDFAEEGMCCARRALENSEHICKHMVAVANYVLGMSLVEFSRSAIADSDRATRKLEALQALEKASKLTQLRDANIVYYISLEYAEQRKLDSALYYAKHLLKLEGGSDVKGWILLARILSAQKRFADAEIIIDAALDQTGKWDQGTLLKTKAKVQIAQGRIKDAIQTYTQLLAYLQLRNKSFVSGKKPHKGTENHDRHLELETWHDLAYIYICLSRWSDVEVCLTKSKAIDPHSASRWHAIGSAREAKGLYREALGAFEVALGIDPSHVPSLISSAVVLRHLGSQLFAIARSILMHVLLIDRTNHLAWYNLALLHKEESGASSVEAAECFQAAIFLEETAPVEPFR